MKVLLVGGGTMGSVSPLIAMSEFVKKDQPDAEFLFVGGHDGPEKKAVESYNINFTAISSGKLRRYFSWSNFVDPFKICWGFFQSLMILIKFKPNAVAIAGSFVGVPMSWAAFFMRVPVLIHQQDIVAGLANRLMANFAKTITISFQPSMDSFAPAKTVLTGNPVREEFHTCDVNQSKDIFELKGDLPVLLILGGGTGAQKINETVEHSLAELLQFCQVIHITGKGKKIDVQAENYHQFEFLNNEMTEAICVSDLVISRAGMSTLSELIVLGKPVVIVPMPDSHQEINAQYFQKNNAAIVLSEQSLTDDVVIATARELLYKKHKSENLSRNIVKMMDGSGAAKVAAELIKIAK
jgi:UDP-N-acetylglucosamine--N-acetylmuramyl-(pentapeptide) pyrophosphoryl-undecaprenol N-acetylglucosamine transferase